jgi:hypothetical protein
MESKNQKVSVVYLIWIPYGVELFRDFAVSYKKYNSGFEHRLILLFNGVNSLDDINPFHAVAKQFDLSYDSFCKQNDQDLETYFWLAEQFNSSYFLFLNSFSLILDNNWLLKLIKHMDDPKVGIISPSGSYQSYCNTVFFNNSWKWDNNKSLKENYLKYKLLIKAIFYWRFLFPSFPNPHIRTNAFLISRKLFLSLKRKKIKNKFMAYQLESGYNSITRQINKKGYEALIVDKNGEAYKITEWNKANIFWKGNQEDLLIDDKQTEYYRSSNNATKNKLNQLAWGKSK